MIFLNEMKPITTDLKPYLGHFDNYFLHLEKKCSIFESLVNRQHLTAPCILETLSFENIIFI